MNKIKLIIASAVILLALWIASWFNLFSFIGGATMSPTPTPAPAMEQIKSATLSIVFDDGTSINYEKDVSEGSITAFSILEEAADANSLTLDTTQYDFGVFVKSINGQESTAQKSWIYFVNGISGTVSADKYELKPGDKVEWKYVVPEGE